MQMELTSSAAGSRDRASLGPQPGSASAQKMTVTSGLKCCELLKLSGQGGSLARMSEILFQWKWASSAAFLTWKMQVMPSKRFYWALSVSAPRTDVIDAGLWRTPDTGEGGTSGLLKEGKDARENGHQKERERRGNGVDLPTAAKMWPTPTSRDFKSGKGKTQAERNRSAGPSLSEVSGGSLNPNFVEYLMGFPKSWTEAD